MPPANIGRLSGHAVAVLILSEPIYCQ
jgi:hypothetical protein